MAASVVKTMNWRSRLTGIVTGDQAIFVSREAFHAARGFPDISLMEDIALSRRLLNIGRPGLPCGSGCPALRSARLRQSRASTICKESSDSHDYSDSRAPHRSRLSHISVHSTT